MIAEGECSEESLFAGRLRCRQPLSGYRYSVDAVLLAHFIKPGPGDRILDLGAGCGIVALILAHRWPMVNLVALEIQPGLYRLARENAELNGLAERLTVVNGDCRQTADLLPVASCDWVVANPPYFPKESGRHNPESERAMARQEILGGIGEMAKAAAIALKERGRAAFVYPAGRLPSLLAALRETRLEAKRLQMVHPWPGSGANLVLVEAGKGCGEGLEVLPPFFVHQGKGGPYSPEMAGMYLG